MPEPRQGRDHFERAYAHIREQLDSGALRPGERVNILGMRQHLKLSLTPLREALSRLVGQDLIEDRRGEGYYVAPLDAVGARQLYTLHALHLDLAIRMIRCKPPALRRAFAGRQGDDPSDRAITLFAAILIYSRNRPLQLAAQLLELRLRPLRRQEPRLFPDLDDEIGMIEHHARRAIARPSERPYDPITGAANDLPHSCWRC